MIVFSFSTDLLGQHGDTDSEDFSDYSDESSVHELEIDDCDSVGDYAVVSSRRYGSTKFYPSMPYFLKMFTGKKWDISEDFPLWCESVSEYFQEYEFDDDILGKKLTAEEEEALRLFLAGNQSLVQSTARLHRQSI